MEHFTRQEWEQFSRHLIEGQKRKMMEEHLLKCEQCIEKYLSCITDERIKSASKKLSPDFTATVMQKIPVKSKEKDKGWNKNNRFAYYVAAACITIILMSIGVFQQLVNTIPQIALAGMAEKEKLEIKIDDVVEFGWSEKLMNRTLTLVDSLKPKE